jgi:hypothetical protein
LHSFCCDSTDSWFLLPSTLLGFADLVLEGPKIIVTIELKHIPLQFVGQTEHKTQIKSRDEQKMADWLSDLSVDQLHKLLLSTGGCKHVIPVSKQLEIAHAQSVGYAKQWNDEKQKGKKTVVAAAVVGIGTRVVTKASALLPLP